MKKYPVLFVAAFMALLSACPNPDGGGKGNQNEPSPDGKTWIYFVNNNDFPVTLYSDSARLARFAEAGANAESEQAETAPNDGAVFYLRYHILIDDVILPYDGQGLVVRIDEGEINRILIPLLSALDKSELEKSLTPGVHIKIQNAGTFSLSLQRGSREEIPEGASSPIINGGETVRYVVERGPVSNYAFMKNTSAPLVFPAGLEEFLPGHLYSFKFDGTALTLLADKPLTIAQALKIQAPENIGAKSLANGHIALTWDKVGTETGYVIYRSDSQTGDYAPAGRTEVTSYTDAEVDVGNTYYYRISAVKDKIESDKSTTVVSARAEIGSLASPQGLAVTGRNENSITLSWQTVSGATGYKVYKGASAGAVNEYVAELASASYTVTGLGVNTVYFFAVSAVNESGESLPSAAVQGKTSEAALEAPQGLAISARDQTSLTLSWQGVYGAAGYRISRSLTASGDSYSFLSTAAGITYADRNLTPGTTYHYRVTAYNGQGESAAAAVSGTTTSNDGTFPLPPAKPAGLVVSNAGPGSVSLSWSGVSNANSYDIYRTNSKDGAAGKIGTAAGISWTDSAVSPGTAYYYTVRAVNASGNSPESNKAFAYAASHYALPAYASSQLVNLPAGSKHYYRLAVSAGQSVTLTWENGSSQNADYYIQCTAWQNDGTQIMNRQGYGYTSPKAFTAASAGYITVEVGNWSSSASYDYQIYYY